MHAVIVLCAAGARDPVKWHPNIWIKMYLKYRTHDKERSSCGRDVLQITAFFFKHSYSNVTKGRNIKAQKAFDAGQFNSCASPYHLSCNAKHLYIPIHIGRDFPFFFFFLQWTHSDARDVLLALISGHLHPLLAEIRCQTKHSSASQTGPACAVGGPRRSSRRRERRTNQPKGKERRIICSRVF